MSFDNITFADYPLTESEKSECIDTMTKFADYMFGPTTNTSSDYDRAEKVFSDSYYFNLVRKVIRTEDVNDVCIDLSIFIPDASKPLLEEDEDGVTTFLQFGTIKELSAMLSETRINVSHSLGNLVIDEVADVDLRVIKYTDEDPIDPVAVGGQLMLSDQFAVSDVFNNVM